MGKGVYIRAKFIMRTRPGVDKNDTVKCYCMNCTCNNSVEIPCANEFLVCDICLLGRCNLRSIKPRVSYIKIIKGITVKDKIEKAMQAL